VQRFRSREALYFFSFFQTEAKEGIMSEITYLTKEALDHLRAELQKMKAVDRPAASRAIAEAREKGDLRENAEYDAAKESQGMLEAKIQKLEGELAGARILEEANIDTSKVSILTRVTLTNLNNKKQVTYQLVSEKEADLKLGKISVTSPIGKGLLGKLIGQVAEVQVPAGKIAFKIEKIST
jgi:transcription elongation factor GreA